MWRKIKFYFVSLLILGLAALALYLPVFPTAGPHPPDGGCTRQSSNKSSGSANW